MSFSWKNMFRPRVLPLALSAALLLHLGWLWHKVGSGLSGAALGAPSILYGRSTAVRVGDHLDNLRFGERLARLSYRKVPGDPGAAGSYREAPGEIRIFTRDFMLEGLEERGYRADLRIEDGRVVSIATPAGAPVDALWLEPEEIGRIMGPSMEARRVVPLEAVPRTLQEAVVAAEDSRFRSHHGIDLVGVARALLVNLKERRFAQGGSTITQQVARNFFLTPAKTLWRKLREAELAVVIELRYTKKEILSAYLNKIYFGQDGPRGIYGVGEASRFFFSKEVRDLTLEESALLAAVIKSPNRYSPLRMPDAARERRNWVLSRMRQLGMIGEERRKAAARAPLGTRPRREAPHFAGWFLDYVQKASEETTGDEKLYWSGHRFYTTLDPVQQAAAEGAVAAGLAEIEAGAGRNADDPLQAALVAVDPATGELTAMVGGRDYGASQFNRAADARRQPGSAFKPFVLLAAMEQAARGKGTTTLGSWVSGAPLSVATPAGAWSPANNEGKVYGTLTVRQAIEQSVNTATARLANEVVGMNEVVAAARAAGIVGTLSPVPSAALGTFEVTPVELAYAYATLASGGTRFAPHPLHGIVGRDGDSLYAGKAARQSALDPRAAYLVTYALQGVLDRGTGRSARAAGLAIPAAGKTGTTDGFRDSWFAGYTPDVVCVVWVGTDSGRDTGLTGAAGALRIWTRFMKSLYRAAGPREFPVPQGIVTAQIDPLSGYLATTACPETFNEAFLADLVPTQRCPLHPVNAVVDTVTRGYRGMRDFLRNLFK